MDAKEFIAERNRMCDYYGGASRCKRVVGETTESCPLLDYVCVHLPGVTVEVVDNVEQWAKEHPAKTRQSEFMKQFPHAKMWEDGDFIDICPKHLNELYLCGEKRGQTCYECCKDYWGAVVE